MNTESQKVHNLLFLTSTFFITSEMKRMPAQKTAPQKKEKPAAKKLPAAATGFWDNKSNLFYTIFVLVVTAIVFNGSLRNAFVNWDDEVNLLENPNVLLLNWQYVKQIFTDRVIGGYNPLPIFTFAIEHHLVGFEPFLYHLDNLLLHLLCVFFVYRIFVALRLSPLAALFGALLFGIHPMRVESVAWVTERKDVLFGVFYLSALFLYIKNKAAEKPKMITSIAIAVLFILALFSKIQAVSLPLTMLVIDYYSDKKLSRKIILQKSPYFIFSLAFGVAGIYFLKQEDSLQQMTNYSNVDRILVGCLSYVIYIIKFVYPYRMSPLYPYYPELSWEFYAAPAGIITVAALVFIAYRKKWYWFLAGIGIFTVNVIFLLQIIGAGQGLFADRFTYIPYLGFMFIAAYGIDYVQKNIPSRKTAVVSLACIYLFILAVMSTQQISIWKNGGTLWTHVLKYYQNTPLPWQNRARYYRDNQKYDLAMHDLTAALNLKSDRGTTYRSRAKLFFDTSKFGEAIADYDSAAIYKPDDGQSFVNRGTAYGALGEYAKGIEYISKGLAMKVEFSVEKYGTLNMALIYFKSGQYEKAIEYYDKLLELDPTMGNIWYEKALCKRQLGKQLEAIAFIDKAIEIGPPKGLFYYERAKTWATLDNMEKAKADVATAEQMGMEVDPGFKKYLGL